MTPIATGLPKAAVTWYVTRPLDDTNLRVAAVAEIPITSSVDDCKRTVSFVEGRYVLWALDRNRRFVRGVNPRVILVTKTEETAYSIAFVAGAALKFWQWIKSPDPKAAFEWSPFSSSSFAADAAQSGNSTDAKKQAPKRPAGAASMPSTPSVPVHVVAAAKRLGVQPDVSIGALRARRRELARVHHPDRNRHKEATQHMQTVNADYDVLLAWVKARPGESCGAAT